MKVQISKELKDIIPIFLSESKKTLKALEEALEKNDYETMKQLTHKLKGSSGSYGFYEWNVKIKSLEGKIKEKENIDIIKKEFYDISDYYNKIQIEYI